MSVPTGRLRNVNRTEPDVGETDCRPGERPSLEGPAARTVGRLNLDDLVAIAQLIEGLTGHALTPEESSRLKSAYQATQNRRGGATLHAIASILRASTE
jgi:hypothetical protein